MGTSFDSKTSRFWYEGIEMERRSLLLIDFFFQTGGVRVGEFCLVEKARRNLPSSKTLSNSSNQIVYAGKK